MPFQRETKHCGKLNINGRDLEYTLEYKNVKNINLRIKPSGEVCVSANRRVPIKKIESFMASKADFILRALKKYEKRAEKPIIQYFSEDEIVNIINSLCESAYPYFKTRGVKYPQIKFKRLKSRWGSCMPSRGILTFNTNLKYAPTECIRYVVLHEFTHFLVPNHSEKFYYELCKVCPEWQAARRKLREIVI